MYGNYVVTKIYTKSIYLNYISYILDQSLSGLLTPHCPTQYLKALFLIKIFSLAFLL